MDMPGDAAMPFFMSMASRGQRATLHGRVLPYSLTTISLFKHLLLNQYAQRIQGLIGVCALRLYQ